MREQPAYQVTCFHCKRSFDALQAFECDCLHHPRSLRCPHCSACFCTATAKYKTDFWANAPLELWSLRRSLPESRPGDNEPAKGIVRPLVLFADDDAVGRAIARRVLDSMGIGVIVAADGREALALAREYKPELLITDAFMPKLDGRELARTVKEEQPATKVIVISGVYKDPRYKHEALKDFKVDDYLTKPVEPDKLMQAVTKLLK